MNHLYKLLFHFSFLFLLSSTAAAAGSTPPGMETLTPEMLWKLGRVSDPQISYDGRYVIYSVKYYDLAANKGQSDLYRITSDGKSILRLTNTPNANEFNGRWMSDGKIAYLDDSEGDMALYTMNGDGTEKFKAPNMPLNISAFGFSYINGMIYFTQDVKIDKTVQDLYPDLPKATGKIYEALMLRHWNAWEDESYSHIFIGKFRNGALMDEPVDIMKGERYDAPLQPFGGDEQICWSNDGSRLAYTCKKLNGKDGANSTNSDIYVYSVYNQKTENMSAANKGYDVNPQFSADGMKLIWLSMEHDGYEADKNNIMVYDYGLMNQANLTDAFFYSPEKALFGGDGKSVYFNAAIDGVIQLFNINLAQHKINQVTTQMQDVADFCVGEKGNTEIVIGNIMSISMPNELYLINPSGGKPKKITNVNAEILSRIQMGNVEKREIKATDGKDILTWVIYPPGFNAKDKKKYPAILFCQGGPQSPVSQFFSYRWNFQLMAAMGYIVVAPNRRGLPGFGQGWTDQIAGDWGGQAMRDLLSAMDDVSGEPFVDKDKLGCVGASYGGYSVYWLAGNHEKRFKCFIAHCGVFDMTSMYGATEEMFFVNHDFKGPYWKKENQQQYDNFSPHRYVQNWDAPMLVIHNEKDFRVPVTQGMEAFTAAQMQGIPSRFLYFPDEGHWVLKPQNSVLWQRVFFDWLDRYLK